MYCKNVEGRLAGISRVSELRFEVHQQKRIGRFLLRIAGGIIEEEQDIDIAVCGNLAHFYPTVYLMDFRNFTFCNEKCAFSALWIQIP